MFKCRFCFKECKNKNSEIQHEIRCKENPNSLQLPPKTEKWKEAMKNKNARNQYTKAKELGLPKPEISEETRKKLSDCAKRQSETQWTEENRKKHSEIMKNVVKNNPDSYSKDNVCGRVKIYEYNDVKLKGRWELEFAMWLDKLEVSWESESNPHPYFWNNSWHMYFPDFYLKDYDIYVEVKGFRRDRDIAKWSQFKDDLIIVDYKVISNLKSIHSIDTLLKYHKFSGS